MSNKESQMSKIRLSYSAEFRQQMLELFCVPASRA